MYYNHTLRTNLQEWEKRLIKVEFNEFANQLKYLVDRIEGDPQLMGLLNEACVKFPYEEDYIHNVLNRKDEEPEFENTLNQAAYCYQLLKFLTKEKYTIQNYGIFSANNWPDRKTKIFSVLLNPILHYLHDSLDEGNSTLFLLEKYKRRTEWFTSGELIQQYRAVEKNKSVESVLDKNLRAFLFDQGINFPFSNPSSPSGAADIVGAIDTNNPIIIEVKVVDKEKSYGKSRILDGFQQVVRYTNNYNKDLGYLVLFNLDKAHINFKFSKETKKFPPMLTFNNKAYFFVVIDMYHEETASKMGSVETLDVTEEELIKIIEAG